LEEQKPIEFEDWKLIINKWRLEVDVKIVRQTSVATTNFIGKLNVLQCPIKDWLTLDTIVGSTFIWNWFGCEQGKLNVIALLYKYCSFKW
jgi:hypothetical protein